MSERVTVFENVQIGKESTAARGVAVAATRLLRSLMIEMTGALTSRRIRPSGSKVDSAVQPARRSSEGSLQDSGAAFGEICYVLESIFGVVTPTTPSGGTNARQRVYAMNNRGPDTYQSYTVEKGSAAGAQRITHATFTGMTMNFGTEELTVSGALVGKKPERGITMTAAPTALPLILMDPLQTQITVDPTFAAIGTTVMDRVMSATFGIGDKYAPLWTVNRLNAGSFAALVERPVDATVGLVMAADSESNAFLTQFEAGALAYARIDVLGPLIEAAIPYRFTADMAVAVENLSEGDQDDVWADTWGLRMVDSADIPGGIKVTAVNAVTAL